LLTCFAADCRLRWSVVVTVSCGLYGLLDHCFHRMYTVKTTWISKQRA